MKLALPALGFPLLFCLLALVLSFAAEGSPASDEIAWGEVLGPAQGQWAEAREQVLWGDDLRAALAESKQSGRPVLVVARCLPCKQCATFDRDVLEGGEVLTPLLGRF